MEKRFLKLYEAALTRYNRGGFLASDLVKFTDNALRHEFFKNQPDSVKAAVKDLIDSGLNLRVKTVKSYFPAVMGAGNPDYNGVSFNIEIVPEIAPGKFDYQKTVTVPADLLIQVDTYPNLPPVPDKLKYDNKVQIEPKEVKSDTKTKAPFTPAQQQQHSDVGGKLQKGDRELKNVNVEIPSEPVKGHTDPASYTANYLPKN